MDRPYSHVTVLDFTHDLGRYVGRLFADLGANVLRIEPPEGLADRQYVQAPDGAAPQRYEFAFFNASKKSVVVDHRNEAGKRTLADLVQHADIVLVERGGPLYDDVAWLRSLSSRLIITSVSPFGRTGPWRDAPASDLILQAAGGIAWLSGRLKDAPLRLPGSQATMIAGVYAAVATAISLYDASASGTGHLVDVSAHECIAHSLQNSIQVFDFEGRVSMRGGEGTRDASEDMFACKDGRFFLAATLSLGISWKSLTTWIGETGHPAAREFSQPRWNDRVWRMTGEAKQAFRETLESFSKRYTKEELTEQAIKRKIVLGPVSTVMDIFSDPQLLHRQYFETLDLAGTSDAITPPVSVQFPGAPYRLSEPVWSIAPAPALGSTVATKCTASLH